MRNFYDLLPTGGRVGMPYIGVNTIPKNKKNNLYEQGFSFQKPGFSTKSTTAFIPMTFLALMFFSLPYFSSSHHLIVEEACAETILTANNQTVQLAVPKFDPALGNLVKVEVTTDCTLVGDVGEKSVSGSEYQLLLNINLNSEFPGQPASIGTISNAFHKSTKDVAMQSNGFQEKFESVKQSKTTITNNLSAFAGAGNFTVALTPDGLIDFKDAISTITSNLKVKVCCNYFFE
jgi:hypothetical protein